MKRRKFLLKSIPFFGAILAAPKVAAEVTTSSTSFLSMSDTPTSPFSAGILAPICKDKLDFITVTNAVDLSNMEHVYVPDNNDVRQALEELEEAADAYIKEKS